MPRHFRTFFPHDFLTQMGQMMQSLDPVPNIRGLARGYPAINVESSPRAVDVYAFTPGLAPENINLQIERGVLTLSGERQLASMPDQSTRHIEERFSGRFRRVVALPDDIDANNVQAKYRDGVLHVHIPRKEEAQPRRIEIQ